MPKLLKELNQWLVTTSTSNGNGNITSNGTSCIWDKFPSSSSNDDHVLPTPDTLQSIYLRLELLHAIDLLVSQLAAIAAAKRPVYPWHRDGSLTQNMELLDSIRQQVMGQSQEIKLRAGEWKESLGKDGSQVRGVLDRLASSGCTGDDVIGLLEGWDIESTLERMGESVVDCVDGIGRVRYL